MSILCAMWMFVALWNDVTNAGIFNSVPKAKISMENEIDSVKNSNDSFQALLMTLSKGHDRVATKKPTLRS